MIVHLSKYGAALISINEDWVVWKHKKQEEQITNAVEDIFYFINMSNAGGAVCGAQYVVNEKLDKSGLPRLPHCELEDSEGQCDMECPFFNCGCKMTAADKEAWEVLKKEYILSEEELYRGY